MTEHLVDAAVQRKELKGSNFEMTYGGVLSFMRRNYTKNLQDVDIAISGVPFDLGVTYRSGARLGPRAIRAASVQLAELKPYPWGFDPFDYLAVIDYGDCFLDPHNPLTIKDSIIEHIETIINANTFPLTFGGDHYITYPILCAMKKKYAQEDLSIIHFDAHCDTWPDVDENSLNHGTMFYKAVKNKLIVPEKSVQVGIRTYNDDFMGMNVISSQWIHDNGWQKTLEQILNIVGKNPVYLTFDIDCLDPAFAPGTSTPVPGGISTSQALSIIRNLEGVNLIGADIVEVAPSYDHAEITALAAAHIACDIISLKASSKKFNK